MNRKLITAMLLMPSMALFQGCQRETPPQPATAAPAASAPVANQVPEAPAIVAAKPDVAAAGVGSADGMRALAQRSGCFACHAIDKKLVGPAWSEVAAKYRGQKDAEGKLIAKVAKGGGGVWGSTPMPPNEPRVKEGDIQALVRFILALK